MKPPASHIQHISLAMVAVLLAQLSCVPESHSQEMPIPPLQQVREGILDSDVKCTAGLVLVFKAEDLTPACTSQKTMSGLAARKWSLDLQPSASGPSSLAPRSYRLAFLVNYANPNYNLTSSTISNHLKEGDRLIVEGLGGPQIKEKLQAIRSAEKNGARVDGIIIYNSIKSLTSGLQGLPPGYDYVGYDYEKGVGFSPEFTTNEAASIGYFDQARDAVQKYNLRTGSSAKLLIMPPYGELRTADWDWGLAARHSDAIDIQLQAFIKNTRFLNYTLDAIAQIRLESPSTETFVQISLVQSRGTAMENLAAVNSVHALPIDAFFIFHHPNQTSEVEQFLKLLP